MEHSPQMPTSPPPKLYKPSSNSLSRTHDRLRIPLPLRTHPPARNKTPSFIRNFLPPHQHPTRPTPTPSQPAARGFLEKGGFSCFFLVLDRQCFRCNIISFDNKLLLLKKTSLKQNCQNKTRLRTLSYVFFNRSCLPVNCTKTHFEVCPPLPFPPGHFFFRTYHYILSSTFMTNRTHRQLCLGFGP